MAKTLPPNLRDGLQLWIDGSNNGSTTYYDVSGAGITMTSNNVTTTRRLQHKINTFNGSDSRLTKATSLINALPITTSYWIYLNSKPTGTNLVNLVTQFPTAATTGWDAGDLYAGSSELRAGVLNSTFTTYSYTNLSLSTWYHITVVMLSTGVYIYVNGKLVASNVTATTYTSTTEPLGIGYWTANNGRVLDGKITNVMVWNRELSANEIQQLRISQYIK